MQRLFFSILFAVVLSIADGNLRPCDHLGTVLYEDLGCKPMYDQGEFCPTRFSCNPFEMYKEVCLFRGKKYKVDEKIDDNLIVENCFYDCKCADPAGYDKYKCNLKNCTEWNETFNSTRCYKKYAVDQCCSVGTECWEASEMQKRIFECKFEGKIYKDGQIFRPKNSCTKCVCRKGFRGVVEEPFCRRALCATQVIDYEELENYCAPLYKPLPGDTALCCPIDWVCHSENDTIENIAANVDMNTNVLCQFGPKNVRRGEGVRKIFEHFGMGLDVTCECKTPPFMTCTIS